MTLALASASFVFGHLLATVTTAIPLTDPKPLKQEDMDQLMRHELLVEKDGNLAGGKRVLWEEGIHDHTSSILDILIPSSNLTIQDLYSIRYAKKKGDFILHGSSILMNPQRGGIPQWRLNRAFTGQLKKTKKYQSDSQDTDVETVTA
ncbi:hypothetical protein DEU56DRAFT_759943 [Suillus clintonianus]|uniref:uncharacterized protein n=1 Tax=Suillus clintonianus TaxID=1904413 RepID=UPI001B880485|nr:uncharacterized protein DEU56DRAFT_759943 [Suillus clintonianus]KAG2123730.1 hypothetical protein DEU56DRAFT_759943 [Suillus clintonianus]